eukprot:gene1067-862_t
MYDVDVLSCSSDLMHLHVASTNGHAAVVQALTNAGADTELKAN